MKQYLDLLTLVKAVGVTKDDRTGTGTQSIFGHQMRFNLKDGFPLVTTKKVHTRSIVHELLWFLKGETNVQYLQENGVKIWDEWATKEDVTETVKLELWERVDTAVDMGLWRGSKAEFIEKLNSLGVVNGTAFLDSLGASVARIVVAKHKGDLGPVYGKQWRDWVGPNGEHIDQIQKIIDQLNNDPDSRRIIVSAWNVGELKDMALVPCHAFFQFYTRELDLHERAILANLEGDKEDFLNLTKKHQEQMSYELDEYGIPTRELSCQLYQRSVDCFLGLPFNIASYAMLVHMVAQQVNMSVGDFVWTGGDTHIYSNHVEQVDLQLTREPLPLCTLKINRKPDSIFDYKYEDFEFVNYESHGVIKAPVAV